MKRITTLIILVLAPVFSMGGTLNDAIDSFKNTFSDFNAENEAYVTLFCNFIAPYVNEETAENILALVNERAGFELELEDIQAYLDEMPNAIDRADEALDCFFEIYSDFSNVSSAPELFTKLKVLLDFVLTGLGSKEANAVYDVIAEKTGFEREKIDSILAIVASTSDATKVARDITKTIEDIRDVSDFNGALDAASDIMSEAEDVISIVDGIDDEIEATCGCCNCWKKFTGWGGWKVLAKIKTVFKRVRS